MAESTFTQTGVEELRSAVNQLPDRVTAALKGVASATAHRVLANWRANLAARTNGEGNTARALTILEDSPNKQYQIYYGLILFRPSNLPIWIEYGFMERGGRFHPGKYVAHDAAKVEEARYHADMDAAATDAAAKSFGGSS